INKALDVQPAARHTHSQWTSLLTCALPYMSNALSKVVTTALKQICHNIEALSQCYSASCTLASSTPVQPSWEHRWNRRLGSGRIWPFEKTTQWLPQIRKTPSVSVIHPVIPSSMCTAC
ncbi:unnamed protein product, partial [Nesidiocoris tenuis]